MSEPETVWAHIELTEELLGFPVPEPALDAEGNPILNGEWTVKVGDWRRSK